MIKTSVKKPYTVFVSVILCLVLGVVSFTGLKTDLLPSMDLPIMLVSTIYPGASPEKVELTVTDPIENAVSTISGIEDVTSISNENMSMIIIQFTHDTNMDSAMLDVSNALQSVTGRFDEMVQTPTVMKLNPDMMPIQVISVDAEGLDIKELTTKVKDDIIPEFERIYGVAKVNTEGLVNDYIQIQLNQERIDEINDNILRLVDKDLLKAKYELDEAQEELNKGIKELEDGQKEAFEGLAQGSASLDSANAQMQAVNADKTKYDTELKMVQGQIKGLEGIKALKESLGFINSLALYDVNPASPLTLRQIYDMAVLATDPMTPVVLQGLFDSGMVLETDTRDSAITKINESITSTNQALLKAGLTQVVIDDPNSINVYKQKEVEAKEEFDKASFLATQLSGTISEIEKGIKELEAKKMQTTSELTKANVELSSAQKELDKGIKEFENARDSALEKANIDQLVTLEALSGILQAQNFSMPSGSIKNEKGISVSVKVGNKFTSIDNLENLMLLDMGLDGLDPIYLKDVANIEMKDNSDESYTYVNGNPGVILSFQKSSVASTTGVTERVTNKMQEITAEDSSIRFAELSNQGIYINMVINGVMQNLLYGGLIAFFLLLVFLKDLRPTLVIVLSIPISLLFAIVLMYFSGISLNIISLSGLSLGVGMLVDNSIVVIENIYRLRNEGLNKYKAAVVGAQKVSMAIFASTLTTVCVFLPIVFVEGMTRDLFTDMGLTIAYSLFASLTVALTVVPSMASTLLSKTTDKENKTFNKLVNIYEKLLKKNIKHGYVVILLSIGLLVLSVYNATKMPLVLVPEMSSSQLTLTYNTDLETPLDTLFTNAETIANNIEEIEGVDTVGVNASSTKIENNKPITFTYYIILKEEYKSKNKDIVDTIIELNNEYKENISVQTSNMDLGMLAGDGLTYKIKGNDLDVLQELSTKLKNELETIEGVDSVTDGTETNISELRIDIDKNKASKYNLMVASVYKTVSDQIKVSQTTSTMTFNSIDYETIIIPSTNVDTDNIKDIIVTTHINDNDKEVDIRLEDIADIYYANIPSAINHDNQSRVFSVTASMKDGYNTSLVSRDATSIIDNFELPSGYILESAGEDVMVNQSVSDMVNMILLAVVFIYLIMVAQFQSLLSPFIILFTIPLAFTGGLLGLQFANQTLSITAMIGFLVLAGVVVNNGIVFVDYVNQLRLEGYEKDDALIKAGKDRIKPILMTALTTILAMSTMALGIGEGAEMSQGMAIVTVGGLSYATLLTLFLVPVLYKYMYRRELKNIDKELDI